jgi:hypothetical protein
MMNKPGSINTINETWTTIHEWATAQLRAAREAREARNADVRELDYQLGRVAALNELLNLPAELEAARKREPVSDDRGFGDLPDIDL